MEKSNRLSILKKVMFVPVLIITMAVGFYLLLVLAYSLPTEPMQEQMIESSSIFQEEGTYPRKKSRGNSQLDNYTDAIMLLTAAYPENDNVWEDAIHAERYKISKDIIQNESTADALVYLYQEGVEDAQSTRYARYWHGYLVFLKPLLMFLNYEEIRLLIKGIQSALFVSLLFVMFKKKWQLVIPLLITGIFLNLSTTTSSLQFNTLIIITFIAMLFILLFGQKTEENKLYFWYMFFLMVGALTVYFDLLTYPLVSLGLPLVLWIVLNLSEKFITNIKNMISLSAFWGIGYGGIWALKWIFGAIITKENIIGDAVNKIVDRTSAVAFDNKISYFDVIIKQVENSLQSSWAIIVLLLAILWIINIFIKKCIRWELLITLGMISIFPMLWYFILKNHSYIHCWFTYRELVISLFAMSSYIMLELFEKKASVL